MTAIRNGRGTALFEDLCRGAGFGATVGLLELHATYVTTGQFSWPVSLAVLSYDVALGAVAGILVGSTYRLVRRTLRVGSASSPTDPLIPYLAMLLVVRCLADGIWVVWNPALEQSRLLLAQATAICVAGAAALVLGVHWFERGRSERASVRIPAVALGLAALLFCGVIWRSFTVGDRGRTAFVVHLLVCTLCCGIAYRATRAVSPRTAWGALAVVLLLPPAGRLVLGPPERFAVRDRPVSTQVREQELPNLILIVLDTLRADHLDLYGYHRPTSPNLTRFAARAATFSDCVSNSSWTLPGHASLFTGLHSRDHGAHGGPAGGERPGTTGGRPLADGQLTLAEILRDSGYRTEAVVSNWLYLNSTYGLDQGFDYWDGRPGYRGGLTEGYFPLVLRTRSLVDALPIRWIYRPLDRFDIAQKPYRRARAISEAASARLEAHGSSDKRPLFLFLNYMDPHDPYLAPEEFADRFPGRLRDRPRIVRALDSGDLTRAELRDHLVSQYDSEIASMDHHLGPLLEQLDRRGMLEDSLVVITSDHGEAFGEHGVLGHGRTLYREELRVPLIVYDPAEESPGRTVDSAVELRALMPWILSRLGLPLPEGVPAADIFHDGSRVQRAELYGGLAPAPRAAFDERCDRVSLRRGPLRAIRCSNGRTELYDLSGDPRESNDLGQDRPELTGRFEQEIREWISAGAEQDRSETPELGPEEIERLRALGYAN